MATELRLDGTDELGKKVVETEDVGVFGFRASEKTGQRVSGKGSRKDETGPGMGSEGLLGVKTAPADALEEGRVHADGAGTAHLGAWCTLAAINESFKQTRASRRT